MNLSQKLLLSIIPLILIKLVAQAQFLPERIDSLVLKSFINVEKTGGVILVAQNGKPIYNKAFGKSNIELDVEMTPSNVFQIGSMTKQFTAIAILILEESGKLNVNDPISKYISDYPGGDGITIHHLLTHTSGIKDFTKMKSLTEISLKEMSPQMMVDFFKSEPVGYQPGEKFEYNNSGYVVLGHIIELVSGGKYSDFIKSKIFDKAGMTQSYFASDRTVIENRAYGYHKKEYGYVNKTAINFSVPFASGALMSTTSDMLKWQNALKLNTIVTEKTSQKVFSKNKLNNGEPISYGYGWHIREINGMSSYEHGGSIFGFKSMGIYLPKLDLYVLGITNCDCDSPTALISEITKLTTQMLKQ